MNGFGNQSGGSLFGQQNNTQPGGALFGGNSSTNTFGSSAPKRTQSVGGMFGSTGSPASNTGGIFGSSSTTGSGTGLFGSASANNNTNTGSTGLFGSTAANKQAGTTPLGTSNPPSAGLFGNSNQQNGSAAPSGGLFGSNTQQNTNTTQSGGLFGNNQQSTNTGQTGGLFGSANQSNQSGGLFGQSNQQNTGGSLFGKPQAGSTGLFGSSTTGANTGGLFGAQNQNQNQSQTPTQQQPQQGLFGTGASSQPAGGLFGRSSGSNQPGGAGTGSLLGNNNSNGGLFGSKPNGGLSTGGLFGSSNATTNTFGPKPASASMFGSLASSTQQSQTQQPLHATIDHASYVLPGVSPSQKLYSSLTQPAQKRTAHEAHGYSGYSGYVSKESFKTSDRDYATPSTKLPLEPSKSSPVTITGPSAPRGARTAVSSTNVAHGEPRQWINSYDKFLKERPTTLTIKREGRYHEALPNPPVSTAPPAIASVATESSGIGSRAARDSAFVADRSTAPIEPDVSLFHRQANNMTVVQVSKKALEEGYYIFPRLEALSAMSKSQLAAVPNLVVGREKYGQIEYPGTVDLSRIGNLGDILGSLVVFEAGTVCVYPDEESKALPGHELNMPCTVTIENAWPVDAVTRKRITDMEDPRMQKHINRLREKCESDGGEFVTFAQGIWVFKVPHFSKWGLPVEDMVVDSEDKLTKTEADVSPVLISADSVVEADSAADAENLDDTDLEDENMLDAEHESAEPIENWQEQLIHAAFSSYTASHESLAAATSLLETHDLESVLLPKVREQGSEQKPTGIRTSGLDAENRGIAQDAKTAIQGPLRLDTLRRHALKSQRDNSSLPLLHTKLGADLLQKLRPEWAGFWKLLAILYAPNGLDRAKLSQWLDMKVSGTPKPSHANALDNIWEFLTTHRLPDAVELSLQSNNPHLAVLISLFENHNSSPEDADLQLRSWKETRSLASVPPVVKHVWELASGAAPATSGLNWAQWLGMRLWYSQTSVDEAASKVPASLLSGSGPELSLIRQSIGSKQLKAVIEELSLVDAFFFLQALDTASPLTVKQDLKCYDNVCSSLAKVLQDIGEPSTAIYVALHIKDAKQCFDVVHNILVDVSDTFSLQIIQDLGVPEQLLDEARAAHARNTQDYYSGAEYLLRAGLYEQAHQVVVTYVAPQAVLDGKLENVEALLLSLESKKDQLRRWSLGGEVYLLYLRALNSGKSLERYDLKSLCNACRYAHTPNLQSQAAIALIAKWASSTSYAVDDFGPDVVLNMKLDPSQIRLVALQQASRLLK